MKTVFTFTLLLFGINGFCQAPEIEWQNTIGGEASDGVQAGFQMSDGNYFVAGYSHSDISGDKTEDDLGTVTGDYWILKLDTVGNIIWQNTIGGSSSDLLYVAIETTDGGYFLGGHSTSGNNNDKTEGLIGLKDYWVVKTDYLGNVLWDNTIGGTASDYLYDVIQTIDGGYLIGGYSESGISGDKSESCIGGIYYGDYWVVKLDSNGNVEWDKTLAGEWKDELFSVVQSADGGYLLGGGSASAISGNKTVATNGSSDFWLVKINPIGEIEWQKSLGGSFGDVLKSIEPTLDGGYLLGGISNSPASGDKSEATIDTTFSNTMDYWIVKIDDAGNIIWENTIGGSDDDRLECLDKTNDGGFIIGGYSLSNISGDKTQNRYFDSKDFWIVKVDSLGVVQWDKTIGGDYTDYVYGIDQTSDFGFFVAGQSSSDIYGDKTENNLGIGHDIWVVKLFPGCTPTPELCNSLDDNCNGLIDDAITETISISAGGPITFCQGGNVLLTATYSGATVQWKKNGVNIPGATSPTYLVNAKGTYTCETTSPCDTELSIGIFVNVLKNPPASITAGGATTFCAGGSVVLTANAGGGLSYQWYKSASLIAGATSINYTATLAGNYKCRVTKTATGCFKNSNVIIVSVPCKEGELVNGEDAFTIYPNPNDGTFTIESNVKTQDFASPKLTTIEIYNNLGQLIYLKEINTPDGIINELIEIENIIPGIYLVKLSNNNLHHVRNIIFE